MKNQLIFLAVLFILPPISPAQIIISEVMFDPLYRENSDEFIELFNTSTRDSIDLQGLLIGDQRKVEPITAVSRGTILPPQNYALIFDRDYFTSSATYDSLIPQQALLLSVDDATLGSGGLSNSRAETVLLLSAQGDTLAVYRYSIGNAPGFSDEKIDPYGGDDAGNWQDSRILHGTPGARNSVTPWDRDLVLSAAEQAVAPAAPRAGEPFELGLRVHNAGRKAAPVTVLTISLDGEELASETLPALASGREKDVVVPLRLDSPGAHLLRAVLLWSDDEQPANNTIEIPLQIAWPELSVVINEIMYRPAAGQPEWIEIFNRAQTPVLLAGWQIRDSSTRRAMIADSVFLAPEGFAVIAADSSVLDYFLLPEESPVVVAPGFPALNNGGDAVVLADAASAVIDSLRYAAAWGETPGRSLERRNPHAESTVRANWGLAVNAAGATPGRRNSLFRLFDSAAISLQVTPDPFTPDGDGVDEEAEIAFTLPPGEFRIRLMIYDMRGRQVRQVLNNAPGGTGRVVRWDGRDEGGRLLRAGIYVLYLEAIDAVAGTLSKATATLVLARKP